jgi:RNA polymerase sigma-70 factor, ECF subfamily
MQLHEIQLQTLEDPTLVTLAQSGNDQAFSELMARHQKNCLKLALSILRHQEDAEDEVQNAFWKAYGHIRQFQQDAKFSTWLTRIVVNQCLMRLRQNKRARWLYLDEAPVGEEKPVTELAAQTETPEQEVAQTELAAVLNREIRRIPPLMRDVFLLREVHRLPMAEVALRLGITVAAAKSRLLRARLELRERMGKHCGRLGPATLLAH